MLRIFPVAASGDPKYSDTFGAARGGGGRQHQGTDIFAARGTPVFAVQEGVVGTATDPLGGTVVNLTATDGRQYYYAHLASVEGAFPRAVNFGDVIGYVGSSGNASGTAPHLHFQIYNFDGAPLNPFPELLGFLPVNRPRTLAQQLNSPIGLGAVLLLLLLLSRR